MNYLSSNQIDVTRMEPDTQASEFPLKDLIIRGVISGVVLAMSASRTGAPISDESIIPISIGILMMLCIELVMGIFAVMAKRTNIMGMFRNLIWVGIGNGLGFALYGIFFVASMTTKLAFATTSVSDKMIGMDNVRFLGYSAQQGLDFIPNLMQYLLPS